MGDRIDVAREVLEAGNRSAGLLDRPWPRKSNRTFVPGTNEVNAASSLRLFVRPCASTVTGSPSPSTSQYDVASGVRTSGIGGSGLDGVERPSAPARGGSGRARRSAGTRGRRLSGPRSLWSPTRSRSCGSLRFQKSRFASRSVARSAQQLARVVVSVMEPSHPQVLVVADQRRLVVRDDPPVAAGVDDLGVGGVAEALQDRPLARLGPLGARDRRPPRRALATPPASRPGPRPGRRRRAGRAGAPGSRRVVDRVRGTAPRSSAGLRRRRRRGRPGARTDRGSSAPSARRAP